MRYRAWTALAQDAQARGDWVAAKEYWYRAAEEERDGDMRAYYNSCEDACGEQVRAGLRSQAWADMERAWADEIAGREQAEYDCER